MTESSQKRLHKSVKKWHVLPARAGERSAKAARSGKSVGNLDRSRIAGVEDHALEQDSLRLRHGLGEHPVRFLLSVPVKKKDAPRPSMRFARPFRAVFMKMMSASRERAGVPRGGRRARRLDLVVSSPAPARLGLSLSSTFSTSSSLDHAKFPAAADGVGGRSLGLPLQRRMQTLMREHAELSAELLEASGGDADFDADRVTELSKRLSRLEPPVAAGRELIALEDEAADLRGMVSGEGDGEDRELAAMAAAELEE